jgi:uncharacterized protein HemX
MADAEPTPEPAAKVEIEGHASVIGLIIAALITGILAFFLGLARRQAAIERNKRLVLEEKLERVKEQAKLDENQKVRDEAAKKVLDLQVSVDNSNERIEELDKQHLGYVEKLKKVNSWDDLFKD